MDNESERRHRRQDRIDEATRHISDLERLADEEHDDHQHRMQHISEVEQELSQLEQVSNARIDNFMFDMEAMLRKHDNVDAIDTQSMNTAMYDERVRVHRIVGDKLAYLSKAAEALDNMHNKYMNALEDERDQWQAKRRQAEA